MRYEFWRHFPSGCVFAVQLDEDDKPRRISEELHYSEVANNDGELYDPSNIECDYPWTDEMNPDDYRLVVYQ